MHSDDATLSTAGALLPVSTGVAAMCCNVFDTFFDFGILIWLAVIFSALDFILKMIFKYFSFHFFHPYFFIFFLNFIFLVSVVCLALEYISLKILQNQINMFGVLVVVLVVQFTKTKVAIHANVSWSSVASRSVSFWEVFFSSSSQPMRKFYFFRKIILADHCPENGPCAPRTSQVRIFLKKRKTIKKFKNHKKSF